MIGVHCFLDVRREKTAECPQYFVKRKDIESLISILYDEEKISNIVFGKLWFL